MLTRKNIQDRLNFCKQYKDWSSERWSKVLFSDESTICQFGTFVAYVRCQEHDRYCVKNIIPTVKSQNKVMVWGAISGGGGHGPLHFLPQGETANSKKPRYMGRKIKNMDGNSWLQSFPAWWGTMPSSKGSYQMASGEWSNSLSFMTWKLLDNCPERSSSNKS